MVTVFFNTINDQKVSISNKANSFREMDLPFEQSRIEMKKAIERDLKCIANIKWSYYEKKDHRK